MGLTAIMRLNNLSGYVGVPIPGKRLLLHRVSHGDARVCIAAVTGGAGGLISELGPQDQHRPRST